MYGASSVNNDEIVATSRVNPTLLTNVHRGFAQASNLVVHSLLGNNSIHAAIATLFLQIRFVNPSSMIRSPPSFTMRGREKFGSPDLKASTSIFIWSGSLM